MLFYNTFIYTIIFKKKTHTNSAACITEACGVYSRANHADCTCYVVLKSCYKDNDFKLNVICGFKE